MTDPSSRIAAKAWPVAWNCCTPLSWSRIAELSPPSSASPQVTMAESPWHHKAQALFVAASCGWSTRAVRHSPSSISASCKVLSGSIKTRFLAVISLRHFRPKARWAAVLKSWTVEEGRSVRSSGFPFIKAIFTWSIRGVLRILATQNISNESLLQTLSPSQARMEEYMEAEAPQTRIKVFEGISLLNYRGRGSRRGGLLNIQQDHDRWHA